MTSYELRLGAPRIRETAGESRSGQAVCEPVPRLDGIVERTVSFADRILKPGQALPTGAGEAERTPRLVRAGMSVGANVGESQAADSRADLIHQLRVSKKECRESAVFIRRIGDAWLLPSLRLTAVLDESDQRLRLLTSIILSGSKGREESAGGPE